MNEIKEGFVYGYLDQLEAKLPEDNEVVIECEFRKEVREITTRREGELFVIDRRFRLPLNIKLNESGEMKDKILVLKMYRITSDDDRRLFADFRVNLKDHFRPQTMKLSETETRAKMTNKPVLTWSFAVLYKTDPRPSELSDFVHATLHRVSAPSSPTPKAKSKNHILHLEDSGEFDAETMKFSNDNSDASFDEDITEHYVQLTCQDSESGIEEFIARNWFDLSKSEPGYPGYKLSKAIINRRGEVKTALIKPMFSILEDVRTTTKTIDSAVRFYCACLCFYHRVNTKPAIANDAKALVYRSIDTAAAIMCDELQKIFMTSLSFVPGSTEFRKHVISFRRKMTAFKGTAMKHLLAVVLDQLDCNLCNVFITQNAFDSLTKVVNANTAIAEFEAALKIGFPRFRQVLLCIIAHDTILLDNNVVSELVPLVPPTFIYFAMCIVKKDALLPGAINYKQLEAFANNMNVNFHTNISEDIMFRREQKELPGSCPEFSFTS